MKKKSKTYETRDGKACLKKYCFVPFSGNGRDICRLFELGQCLPRKDAKAKK